jgi:hypothetical protein
MVKSEPGLGGGGGGLTMVKSEPGLGGGGGGLAMNSERVVGGGGGLAMTATVVVGAGGRGGLLEVNLRVVGGAGGLPTEIVGAGDWPSVVVGASGATVDSGAAGSELRLAVLGGGLATTPSSEPQPAAKPAMRTTGTAKLMRWRKVLWRLLPWTVSDGGWVRVMAF